jgi:hypothetical protein
VYIGGVHIHHQVWGILLVLLVGLLEIRYAPGSPWVQILATLFSAGAALALDEFALWLHLEDVYWTQEGRKSIDAVMVVTVVGLALLAGTSPIGVEPGTVESEGLLIVSIGVLAHLSYTIICLLREDRRRAHQPSGARRCSGWLHPSCQAIIFLSPALLLRGQAGQGAGTLW